MKKLLLIVLLISAVVAKSQTNEEKLSITLKEFHQALVTKNTVSVNQQTDRVLSYGHSNGWVESKSDLIKNLETGYINYHSYKEDSLQLMINGNIANARFVADINVTLNGNTGNYHLKVLEVWVKKGKRWLLFARQAVKSVQTGLVTLRDGFYRLYEDGIRLNKIEDKTEKKIYSIDSLPEIEVLRIKEAKADTAFDKGRNYGVVNIVLTGLGQQQMRKLTSEWKGNKLGFVLDNELVFAALIFEPIFGEEVAFSGRQTNSEIDQLAKKINDRVKK